MTGSLANMELVFDGKMSGNAPASVATLSREGLRVSSIITNVSKKNVLPARLGWLAVH
jgi:hypothetical protein